MTASESRQPPAHQSLDLGGEPEIGGAESRQRLVKVQQPGEVRIGQHAQCPRYVQVPALRLGSAGLIVDQYFVGSQQLSQSQSGWFPWIEEPKRKIRRRVRPHFEPIGRRIDPGLESGWRPNTPQFLDDSFGHYYSSV
jgi:hypothetical protein